ncbi:hypothetical protein [Microcoleus sp. Pol11C3]|uniref:hypothetical protein n=1 Tax=Microcoleus sp. Pol11C3 TaxID=3055390 RepID=UPI002FD11D0A
MRFMLDKGFRTCVHRYRTCVYTVAEDWGKTPTSVKKLVEAMAQQIEQQEKKLTEVLIVQEHRTYALTK